MGSPIRKDDIDAFLYDWCKSERMFWPARTPLAESRAALLAEYERLRVTPELDKHDCAKGGCLAYHLRKCAREGAYRSREEKLEDALKMLRRRPAELSTEAHDLVVAALE